MWPGQGGLLRPDTSSRPAGSQRLHPLHGVGGDDRRESFRPPDLPLRADLLQLGDGHGVLLGELREPQRGVAERPVGTRRRADLASHGSADGGGPAGGGRAGGFQATLPGVAESLRLARAGDPGGQGQRERRRGAEAPPFQDRRGPGPDATRQPGLLQPRRLLRLPEGAVRPAKRRPSGPTGRGTALAAAVAGTSAGGVQTAEGAGGRGQHRAGGGERLLGGQPADRRVGRGPAVRRAGRNLVRPEAAGATAPSAGAWQAPDRVPPRHRLAGPQAGCLRQLPLPGGPVPQQPLPHGLRPAPGAATGAGCQGVPADPAPGGGRGRGERGVGVGRPAGCGRAVGRRRRERGAASARPGSAGDRSDGAAGGPEPVRRLTGRQGGRRWRRTRT